MAEGDGHVRDANHRARKDGGRVAPPTKPGPRNPLEAVGALSQRAPVGNRQGGLQRERRRLGLLFPRSGALARLSLGRGWGRWLQRRKATFMLCSRSVEPQGSHTKRADVWSDQRGGEPWRRREGILLLHRQYADPL